MIIFIILVVLLDILFLKKIIDLVNAGKKGGIREAEVNISGSLKTDALSKTALDNISADEMFACWEDDKERYGNFLEKFNSENEE